MADGGFPANRPRSAPLPALLDSRGHPLRARALYDGARHTRRTAGWHANSTGPNAEIIRDLPTLRNRHRDLARNNPWVRRAIQAIVTNTVGPGIRAQWEADERQNRWAAWWESTDCDADGRHNGYGLQALALRAIVESGAVLIRARPRRPGEGLAVPLQLQVLEPDYLDHAKTETLPNGGYIHQGVEFNAIGRRVAYWLHQDHPGEALTRLRSAGTSKRYSAATIAHVFRVDRPGQVHGVPWGTGAMTRAKMLDDYEDAELERQRLAACFMAFRRPSLDAEAIEGQEYEFSDRVEPGLIEDLPPGWDMSFAEPPQPADNKDFKLSVLRGIASDFGVPFEVITGDLSEVNFSSARMSWGEFARNIDAWRWQVIEPQLLSRIAAWYLEAERVVGHDDDGARVIWTAPARTMVDESREVPPLIEKLRAGLVSHPEAIRRLGYDPLTLVQEEADFLKLIDSMGLKLSSVVGHDADQQAPSTTTEGDA